MKRAQGAKGLPLIECINRHLGKYRIRWDIRTEEEGTVSFYEMEIILRDRLRFLDIKTALLEGINSLTDKRILSEFKWKNMPVWLSNENQFNYKAAYDLCVQSGGTTLPAVFKFGTTENPIYYEFKTMEDLSDFYIKAMQHISNALRDGWIMKDSINWDDYKKYTDK